MKPLDRPPYIDAYLLLKLSHLGKFEIESVNVTEQGDIGVGFYTDLKKVQYQQTILALKGIQTHIYHIEHPL
jgi:hypothetical protein